MIRRDLNFHSPSTLAYSSLYQPFISHFFTLAVHVDFHITRPRGLIRPAQLNDVVMDEGPGLHLQAARNHGA